MVNDELLSYVRKQLAKKVSKGTIYLNLEGAGWDASDIDEAFGIITPVPVSTPAPVVAPVMATAPIAPVAQPQPIQPPIQPIQPVYVAPVAEISQPQPTPATMPASVEPNILQSQIQTSHIVQAQPPIQSPIQPQPMPQSQPIHAVQQMGSPMNSTASPEDFINRWSWGGFLLSWIYFLGSRNYKRGFLYLLGWCVPILNIWLWIKSGLHGRKLVWESGKWADFASYHKRQKRLDEIGFVVLLLSVLVWICIFGYVYFYVPKTMKQLQFQPVSQQGLNQMNPPLSPNAVFANSLATCSQFTSTIMGSHQSTNPSMGSGAYTYDINAAILGLNNQNCGLTLQFSKIDSFNVTPPAGQPPLTDAQTAQAKDLIQLTQGQLLYTCSIPEANLPASVAIFNDPVQVDTFMNSSSCKGAMTTKINISKNQPNSGSSTNQ